MVDRIEINKAASGDIKVKALLVIECLMFEDIKDLPKDIHEKVYKFAHCALSKGVCNHCDHRDWERELDVMYENLVASGMI